MKKPPVARKLAVRHTKLVCLTASFFGYWLFQVLIISKYACMVYKHAYLDVLLLLHSAFMLSTVKMPLKGEVGGHASNSHGNYIVHHEKCMEQSWNCIFEFCGNPNCTIYGKLNTEENAFRATESQKLRFKSYPPVDDFCYHLIIFVNSLYPRSGPTKCWA